MATSLQLTCRVRGAPIVLLMSQAPGGTGVAKRQGTSPPLKQFVPGRFSNYNVLYRSVLQVYRDHEFTAGPKPQTPNSKPQT